MAKLNDLTGKKFNMLTVIERAENAKNGRARWKCQCECGNYTVVTGSNLKNGAVKSCGCLVSEKTREKCGTHLQSKTRIYHIWGGMIQRCENPNSKSYKDYGEKGITVCKEWRESFEIFRDWSMKNGYEDNLTLERRNYNFGYSPENCTWISKGEQAKNRESNLKIKYKNEIKTLAEWCRILNLHYKTTYMRMWKYGWSVEEAFEIPKGKRRKRGKSIGDNSD